MYSYINGQPNKKRNFTYITKMNATLKINNLVVTTPKIMKDKKENYNIHKKRSTSKKNHGVIEPLFSCHRKGENM